MLRALDSQPKSLYELTLYLNATSIGLTTKKSLDSHLDIIPLLDYM